MGVDAESALEVEFERRFFPDAEEREMREKKRKRERVRKRKRDRKIEREKES